MSAPRVLISEDESLVALDIARILKSAGYEVLGPVTSGESAVERAQELRPDVVLMDIVLKGQLDGIAAAAVISDTVDIPVIFLTSHADKLTLERAKIAEPWGYILKPFSDDQLLASLEMALYRRETREVVPLLSLQSAPPTAGAEFPGSSRKVSLQELLRSLELFSELDDSSLQVFCGACLTRTVSRGEYLYQEDVIDPPLFLVEKGQIAMLQSSVEGKELIVAMIRPGDLFGLVTALDTSPSLLAARANRESEVLIVSKKTFLLFLEAHSRLAFRFAEYISRKLRASQGLSKVLAYDDVLTRICFVLKSLMPYTAPSDHAPEPCVLDLTRQDLASLTGSRPETVVRVLKQLERNGLVKLGLRRRIIIPNPKQFSQFRPNSEFTARPDYS